MSQEFQNPQHSPASQPSQSGHSGQSGPPGAPSPRTTLTNLSAAESPNPRTTLSGLKAAETPQSLAAQMLPEDEISRRVREAEEHAKRDYAGYRRGVLGFAVLGYLYIVFVPMVLLLLMLGLVLLIYLTRHLYGIEIQALLGLVIALFAYLKALWVPFPPPDGVRLERGDYPELFNLVDELSQKLNIKVDHVMADDQFNAMVVQRPRLGLSAGMKIMLFSDCLSCSHFHPIISDRCWLTKWAMCRETTAKAAPSSTISEFGLFSCL